MPWSIGIQDRRTGLDQWLQGLGGGPGFGSIVEHHREDRRQASGDTQLLGANEVLIQQTDIGLDAHGHPAVDAGLEFQQQIDVEPVLAPTHAPDDVVGAVAQVVADIAAAGAFECTEIELLYPSAGHEAVQQVPDHGGVREQELVAAVVRWLALTGVRCVVWAHGHDRCEAISTRVGTTDRPVSARPGGGGH